MYTYQIVRLWWPFYESMNSANLELKIFQMYFLCFFNYTNFINICTYIFICLLSISKLQFNKIFSFHLALCIFYYKNVCWTSIISCGIKLDRVETFFFFHFIINPCTVGKKYPYLFQYKSSDRNGIGTNRHGLMST